MHYLLLFGHFGVRFFACKIYNQALIHTRATRLKSLMTVYSTFLTIVIKI